MGCLLPKSLPIPMHRQVDCIEMKFRATRAHEIDFKLSIAGIVIQVVDAIAAVAQMNNNRIAAPLGCYWRGGFYFGCLGFWLRVRRLSLYCLCFCCCDRKKTSFKSRPHP